MVDLRKVERRDRDLDRARHRERRIALDADGLAGVEVERGDADVGATCRRPSLQLLLEAQQARRRGRSRGLRDQRQERQEKSNNSHMPHPRAAALTPESSPNAHIRSKL